MKKLIFIFSTFIFISILPMYGQNQINADELPQYLKTDFFRKFPTINPDDVKWYKSDDGYEARFIFQNTATNYVMTYAGKWIRTESKINETDLPRISQEYIKNNYPNATIKEVYMVQSDVYPGYKVILIDNQKELIINFDKSGNLLTEDKTITTESEIPESEYVKKISILPDYLPSNIKEYLGLSYKNYYVSKVYWAKDNFNVDYYIIELTNDKGDNLVELEFDFYGNLLSQTQETIEPKEIVTKKDKKSDSKKITPGIPETMVPKNAIDYFKKKEKRVEQVKWDTINKNYVVSYVNPLRNLKYQMEFDEKGNWLKTTTFLDPKSLNPMITRFINDNYPGYIINSAENIVTHDKKKYILVEIYSPEWINDPMVYHQLFFSFPCRLEKEILADGVSKYDFLEMQKKAQSLTKTKEYLEQLNHTLDEDDVIYYSQNISPKSLPGNVIKYVNENYSGWLLKEAMLIVEEGQYFYNIYLKKEGWPDRIKLIFDFKGDFISEEKIK